MSKILKAEKLRRERISISLKKFHKNKKKTENKIRKEVYEQLLQLEKNQPTRKRKISSIDRYTLELFEKEFSRTNKIYERNKNRKDIFTKKRTRQKVKAFYNKKDKSKFRYVDKQEFIYKKPKQIDDENFYELENDFNKLVPEFKKFIKEQKSKGKNLINIGYNSQLVFTDKNGENPVYVDNISYNTEIDTIIKNIKNSDKALNNIKSGIIDRFENYLISADSFILKGFEIELDDSFGKEKNNVCPNCSSKLIIGRKSKYKCKDCKYKFGDWKK